MIVVESGGTKSTWIFRDKDRVRKSVELSGIHPREITDEKRSELVHFIEKYSLKGSEVFFYGAGCESKAGNKVIQDLLQSFGFNPIEIASDVVGACIAVLGDRPGIAGILGTGAVAAEYDGKNVVQITSGRGFILGDEGSGFDIGKRITIAYLDGEFTNQSINSTIADHYGGAEKVVHACSGMDSRLLMAGLTKVIAAYRKDEKVNTIVCSAFEDFVRRAILPLPKHQSIGMVGSVAYYFQDELASVLQPHNIQLSKVVIAAAPAVFDFVEENN